jgi:hypothetical protein
MRGLWARSSILLLVAALLPVSGCVRDAVNIAPPRGASRAGVLEGRYGGAGSTSRSVSTTALTTDTYVSIEWGSRVWPRQTDFLLLPSTRVVIDGHEVNGPLTSKYEALSNVVTGGAASVSFESSQGAPMNYVGSSYRFPLSTLVTVTSR